MTAPRLFSALLSPFAAVGRALLGATAALLPRRYWQLLYRLPIREMVVPSAVGTSVAGLIVWGRGFYLYGRQAADAAAQLTLEAAARQAGGATRGGESLTTLAPQLVSIASVVAFTLFTPLGLAATYLTISGLLRTASVLADDALGDPLLTAVDALTRAAGRRWCTSREARRRASEEGPETADRLFTGEGCGLQGVAYAVLASRRKADWTAGTIVITSRGWFRLGEPFDAHLPYGLRTVYPLTRVETYEVLRKAVEYELPPLQQGPGRLC